MHQTNQIRSSSLLSEPRPHNVLYTFSSEEDITQVDALIFGPEETPYEAGFFHFEMKFPANYPWGPPKVLLITTDDGRCRFNPNLYAEGKVCLSILGTWAGPSWTPVQTCMSVLISIQSLMNKSPYHNEPGCEMAGPDTIRKYNDCILHETIRVAVCGMLENPTCENKWIDEIRSYFKVKYQYYRKVCETNMHKDGKPMEDPFGEQRGIYQYGRLLERLERIYQQLPQN